MLEAFILGFWCVWSSDRDIYALTESLSFMILVVLLRTVMAFELPVIDAAWGLSMTASWAYVATVFWGINRFAGSFIVSLALSGLAAVGYFLFTQNIGDWVQLWLL
ncbi:hypothetical protein PL75_06985 [Neisseria arctica]|uniref:Multidrug transporter MatE n=1 Tax=Neisseria arctica TaxID=1470200 RepID=A0A0J0YR78_9NEIS|nr:hypothetical protein [Neisseria arctica]KLT72627.1 hypothetical protein PL75_06985 [Neisseria arctica]UOO86292.1 hypothetical protein LVJ86_08730 [Neisseria arctica]